MKNYKVTFLLACLLSLSLNAQSEQNKNILSTTDKYDFLIGKEYIEVSELGDFEFLSRTGSKEGEIETSSTSLFIEGKQIFTFEKVKTDTQSNTKIRKIIDIIVLEGKYYSCEGCLLANKKNKTIKSIYLSNDKSSVLIAFERDNEKGIYYKVDPENYKVNPNSLKLKKYFNLFKN